ncbi:MAG: T9SS type A sorting domain-containing protein, partial [Bacteroidales bacterium]|nr:T9SS type A sorting domain-containing protein [Bacteroidales bacterium]
ENLTADDVLSFPLSKDGGAVAIIQSADIPVTIEDIPEIKPHTLPEQEPEIAKVTEPTGTNSEIASQGNSNAVDLKIVPNPAKSYIRVETEQTRIIIYDLAGKRIMEIRNYENGSEINISILKSGIYIVTDGIKSAKFYKHNR